MMLLFQLDLKGIACSKGSACQSGSNSGSHVLKAILSEEDFKKPSVRFSFSHFITREEADYVVNVLQEFVKNPVVTNVDLKLLADLYVENQRVKVSRIGLMTIG